MPLPHSKIVLTRVPGFLTNTEFLGGHVVDGTLSIVGRVLIGGVSTAGAGVGSVVGVAGGLESRARLLQVRRNAKRVPKRVTHLMTVPVAR